VPEICYRSLLAHREQQPRTGVIALAGRGGTRYVATVIPSAPGTTKAASSG
jgi:hypothetical protein